MELLFRTCLMNKTEEQMNDEISRNGFIVLYIYTYIFIGSLQKEKKNKSVKKQNRMVVLLLRLSSTRYMFSFFLLLFTDIKQWCQQYTNLIQKNTKFNGRDEKYNAKSRAAV